MARTTSFQTLITLSTIFTVLSIASTLESDQYHKTLNPKQLGLHKREKLTHLHFYFHDIFAGENKTVIQLAGPELKPNSTNFGLTVMIDDPLTVGPEQTSKRIGSAQGLYGAASQTKIELLMVLNYVFTDGEFNGSTLSILGHNEILSAVREMPIVGGTGVLGLREGLLRQGPTWPMQLLFLLLSMMVMSFIIDHTFKNYI